MVSALWRRLWDSERDAAFDIAFVAFLYALRWVLGSQMPTGNAPEDFQWMGGAWLAYLLSGLDVVLLARRRFPLVPMAVVTALTTGQALAVELAPGPLLPVNLSTDPWVPFMTPWTIYAVAAYATGGWRRVVGWGMVGAVTVITIRPWDWPSGNVLTAALVVTAIPALLGLYVGARRRLLRELRDRAERAEREQHLLAERARAEERTRLASEMHDVVTHRLSLMVLQAGALGVTAKDEETRGAAEELRAGGCQALEELRDFVGVLRSGTVDNDQPDSAPAHPLSDLFRLVEESATADVRATLIEDGTPAEVSPTVDRTAYRVVQEALTNVYKHARGAEVRVRLRYGDDRVRLTISNTAPSERVESDLAESGSGTGLSGLTQRVELIGGALLFGPTPDGGFEVDAILPAYVPTGGATADE